MTRSIQNISHTILMGLAFSALLTSNDPASAAPSNLTPVTMQLDWRPNVQFAGILLAKSKGYYEQAGLDVTILPVDKEMKVVEKVSSHSNWVGCSESSVLVNARSHGSPVKAFATMFQGSPFCLMSLKEKGITSISQLAGKRLGQHADAVKAMDIVLAKSGLSRSQVTSIDVDFGIKPLVDGQVDVLMGYMIDEAVELETTGHPINILPAYKLGYVAYSQVYYTSETFLKDDPATLARFLDASNRGWKDALSDIPGAARLVLEKYLPGENLDYQVRSLEKIKTISQLQFGADHPGCMSGASWFKIVESFNETHPDARPVTLQEMTDFSILKKIYPGFNDITKSTKAKDQHP